MKRGVRFFVISVLLLRSVASFSQNAPAAYFEGVALAERHFEAGEYLDAARSYTRAFASNNDLGVVMHRYNAARCWAFAGKRDSAFYQLHRISDPGYYDNLVELSNDPAFETLHDDKRWRPLLSLIRANLEKAEEHLNKFLVARLDTIHFDDQKYRRQINDIENKFGRSSREFEELVLSLDRTDSVNLVKIKGIIDQYGWPGSDVIGERGSQTLFLVIQHADINTQEQYLPLLKAAVKKGDASPSNVALMEDRIAIRRGRKQIYGSQIGRNLGDGSYYVFPIEDPENVDKRRAAVNLPPMKDYVIRWGILWSPDRYEQNRKRDPGN